MPLNPPFVPGSSIRLSQQTQPTQPDRPGAPCPERLIHPASCILAPVPPARPPIWTLSISAVPWLWLTVSSSSIPVPFQLSPIIVLSDIYQHPTPPQSLPWHFLFAHNAPPPPPHRLTSDFPLPSIPLDSSSLDRLHFGFFLPTGPSFHPLTTSLLPLAETSTVQPA